MNKQQTILLLSIESWNVFVIIERVLLCYRFSSGWQELKKFISEFSRILISFMTDKIIGKTIKYSKYLWIHMKRLENRTPIVCIDCYWLLLTSYYKKSKLKKEVIILKAELKGKDKV